MYPILAVLMGLLVLLVIPFTIAAAVTGNDGVEIALNVTFIVFLVIALFLQIIASKPGRYQ
jgi:hypothetical protein